MADAVTATHTPEPWGWVPYNDDNPHNDGYEYDRAILQGWCGAPGQFHEGSNHTLDECGALILVCEHPSAPAPATDGKPTKADADRITACVNNCAGINPAAVPAMVQALRAAAARFRHTGDGQTPVCRVVNEALKLADTPAGAEQETPGG